jgi:mono/diheme cytochrome c family protein
MSQVFCVKSADGQPQGQTEQEFSGLVAAYQEADLALGRRVFLKHCSVCHQATGAGASKAIPPLRDHIPHLAAHPSGRDYLSRLVLFGLNGPITVNGQKFFNSMPALGGLLSDAELASALNYAQLSWGNDALTPPEALVRPEDVARVRQEPKPASATLKLRQELWPHGVGP